MKTQPWNQRRSFALGIIRMFVGSSYSYSLARWPINGPENLFHMLPDIRFLMVFLEENFMRFQPSTR